MHNTVLLFISALVISSCASNSKPGESVLGDFSGVLTGSFEQQTQNKHRELTFSRQKKIQGEEENDQLEYKSIEKQKKIGELNRKIEYLSIENNKLEKLTKYRKSDTDRVRNKKISLQKKINNINRKLTRIKSQSNNKSREEYSQIVKQLESENKEAWEMANHL